MKTCSRQVKPPRNSTKKAVGRRVHTMPAHYGSARQTSLQKCHAVAAYRCLSNAYYMRQQLMV